MSRARHAADRGPNAATERKRRRLRCSELVGAVACVLLTLLHLGARHLLAGPSSSVVPVSALEAGKMVILPLQPDLPEQEGCSFLVSFNADCPACKSAATRERAAARRVAANATTVWVTRERSASLEAFVELLRLDAPVVVDAGIARELRIQAVPGLYVIDRGGVVRWVGPYRGDESPAMLASRCTRAPPDGHRDGA